MAKFVPNKPSSQIAGGGTFVPDHPTAVHHGGGILGAVESGAHWVGEKADLAGRDLKGIPGGLVQTGTVITKPLVEDILHGPTSKQAFAARAEQTQFAKGALKSTVHTIENPLADPLATALTVAPGVGAAGRLGFAGKAALEADTLGGAAKALVSKPEVPARTLSINEGEVHLQPSENYGVRAVQGLHDKIVQHAMDSNPSGLLARYGMHRASGSIQETARIQQRLGQVDSAALNSSAKNLRSRAGLTADLVRAQFGKDAATPSRVNQAALELTSTQTTPAEAVAFHEAQAAKRIAPARNLAVAKLYRAVDAHNLLTLNDHGEVIVNHAEHPHLAAADAALHLAQKRGDEILERYGVRTGEQLENRVNAPGQIRAGGTLTPLTAEEHLPNVGDRVTLPGNEPGQVTGIDKDAGMVRVKSFDQGSRQWQEHEFHASDLDTAKGAIVGGEQARPGRGFVSYQLAEKRGGSSPVAGVTGPVVGAPKSPITGKAFTGQAIEQGHVPADVTGQAARHLNILQRFENTTRLRNQIASLGSPVRQSEHDILVKIPGETHGKIPDSIEALLGRKHLTTDDEAGIEAALQAHREDLVPGLADRFLSDRSKALGEPAPKGHVWVHQGLVGDLAALPRGPRNLFTRSVDNINSAVTAFTVYTKPGHLGTRVLTNASTNLLQGSAHPLAIARSVELWRALSNRDQLRTLAAAGQHGLEALPHEGTSAAARFAGSGAQWWARRIDAPFRANSIIYTAGKAGIRTPKQFRAFLNDLESDRPSEASVRIAKRANREAIAYDRLSQTERRFLARGFWFYPWLRGTANFAVNTALEHPFKSAVLGAAGTQGRTHQEQILGPTPSYEAGLIPFGHGVHPTVADFSTFSPYSTPGDELQALAHPSQTAGFLNPVFGAGAHLMFGLNQYGQHTTSPIKSALEELVSTTPEAQILSQLLTPPKDQSRRMFPSSVRQKIERALGGPGLPRKVNRAALNAAAVRERLGR